MIGLLSRLAAPLLGGLLNRERGGGFLKLPGTTWARLSWALPVGAWLGWLASGAAPLWASCAVPLFAFLAWACFGHGDHQDMGTMPTGYTADKQKNELLTRWLPSYTMDAPKWKRVLIDFIGMTVIGVVRGVVTVLPIAYWTPGLAAAFVLGFSLQGFTYLLGYQIPVSLPSLHKRGPEWGEFLTGMMVTGLTAWLGSV